MASHERPFKFQREAGAAGHYRRAPTLAVGHVLNAMFQFSESLSLPEIPGDQGIMGMQAGGKRKLLVPAHLAYGERTMGKITPNSNLIFEIELLEVLTRDD
jgi:hypothetical protein